jgi:phospholipid/cholesterol/gamma-HCH transport system substrate-binding protein
VRSAIRKHLPDFVALAFLFVVAMGVAAYILSNQRFYLPDWVPVAGTDFYTIEAELETGQAIVPGQGQTVNIAGVKIGDIGKVELEDGRAIVEMKIQRKYAPVYKDTKLLLRPKTGLKDMYLAMEPGTKAAGELKECNDTDVAAECRIPLANTKPDVNPDEILANLDRDARDYLRILLNAGGGAFDDEQAKAEGAYTKGQGADQDAAVDLRETFKRFEPTGRDTARLTNEVAKRRRNIKRLIHNFQLLSTELADSDRQLSAFVSSSNENFDAIAEQDQALRQALRQFPGALSTTRDTLASADELAQELGPTLQSIRPAARALGPSLVQTRPFLRESTPIIRDEIRPFARDARPAVRELRRAAKPLSQATPKLTSTFKVLNALFNTFTFNPRGSEEGFLYWASWVNHTGSSIFGTQDAHGAIRRGLFITNCSSLTILEQIGKTNPNLQVLIDLLNAPRQSDVCPTLTPGTPTPTARSATKTTAEAGVKP